MLDIFEEPTKFTRPETPVPAVTEPKFKFVPAISEQILNVLYKGRETLNGKQLNWWQKNSLFDMKTGLLSAYYLYIRTEDNFKNFRREIQFPADSLFILDSGGYEILSLQNNPDPSHKNLLDILTPEKIVEIQEPNCDIGFILDVPPYKTVIKLDGSREHLIHDPAFFKYCKETTAKNTERALSARRPNSPLKIYGVLQGKDYELMHEWYDRMKAYPVDGYCLTPKPNSDYTKTAMFISLILEENIQKPIHFLGISGFSTFALIIYLLRKDINGVPYYSHLITSDSSSYDNGARRRNYILPDLTSNITIGRIENQLNNDVNGNVFIDTHANSSTIPLNTLPCICPVCQNTSVAEMRAGTNPGSIAVSLHNLYQQKTLIQLLTSLITDPETYKSFVLAHVKSPANRLEIDNFFTLIDNTIEYQRERSSEHISWEAYFNCKNGDLELFK